MKRFERIRNRDGKIKQSAPNGVDADRTARVGLAADVSYIRRRRFTSACRP
jgi:hypothetical protein